MTSYREILYCRVIVTANPRGQRFKPSVRIGDAIPAKIIMLVRKNASDTFRIMRPYSEHHPVDGALVIVELMSRGLLDDGFPQWSEISATFKARQRTLNR